MIEYFKNNYDLTNNQEELVLRLNEFLNSDCPAFLLKGYAGTGKTFIMQGLTGFFTKVDKSFRIAAPTGRAAKVISKKTKHKAYTIHKTIYSNKDLKEFKVKNEDGSETFKFYYDLRNNENPSNTVYIIDEASMLSDAYSETEFFRFGSGFLLKDLIRYINLDNNDQNKKVIFIGDNAQLPPVRMSFSPALNHDYLKSNCNLESKEFELTEVVRQKADSGILYNATILRESIKANIFNQLNIETNYKDINKTKHDEFLEKYINACNNRIDDETIVIVHSNASVKQYNDFIRMHFFPNKNKISVNDKILLVKNNYNYNIELLNGDFGLIKKVNGQPESRTTLLKKMKKNGKVFEVPITIVYRNVEIEFKDIDEAPQIIDCKIVENLLYSDQRDISSDEQKAMYIDFWIRNPKLNRIKQLLYAKSTNYDKLLDVVEQLSPNDIGTKTLKQINKFQDEFFENPNTKKLREISIFILKDVLKSDSYFNALRIKFGYAVTCYKAQGGEWKNTFLNCRTSMGYFNSSYFRWLYTGITRAKENLFTIDEPHFSISSNLLPPKVQNIKPRKDIIVLNKDVLDLEIQFDFSNEIPFTKYIFLTIIDLLKDENISICNIRHTNYLEHYCFSQSNIEATFRIHYNGQNKVTSIEKPANTNQFVDDIYSRLIPIQNKTIVVSEKDLKTFETKLKFDQPFQKKFYESLKNKLEPSNFNITKIEHKPYHEIYEITREGFTATYKFWYDSKSRFKKTEIIQSRTTGLTEEINKLINGVSI